MKFDTEVDHKHVYGRCVKFDTAVDHKHVYGRYVKFDTAVDHKHVSSLCMLLFVSLKWRRCVFREIFWLIHSCLYIISTVRFFTKMK